MRLLDVDGGGTLSSVVLGDDAARRYLCEAGISVVAIEVSIGQLLSFDLDVECVGASEAPVWKWILLENVQHFERSHSLAVRRQFINHPAAVGGRNRFDPLGLEIRQVFGSHHAAEAVRSF